MIHIEIKADIKSEYWDYEVQYFKEHGNTKNDTWNSEMGFVKNSSLYQLYLKGIYEALLYLNTLTGKKQPDINEVIIHVPCKSCIIWLQEKRAKVMLSTKDRAKVKRGYKLFVDAINVESTKWIIKYQERSEEP